MAHRISQRQPAPLPALQPTDTKGHLLPWPTFQVTHPVATRAASTAQTTASHTRGGWSWHVTRRDMLRALPSAALKGVVLALFAAGVLFGLAPAHLWWLDGPRWLLGLLAVGAVGLLLGLDAALALVLVIAMAQAAPGIAAHPLPALAVAALVVALRVGWDWLPARRPS